jgi:tetratricopeptide (TPR) repeat protein
MKPRTILLAALLAGIPVLAASGGERYQVRAAQVDGEWRCSLYADRAPVSELVGALARQCGVTVEGFEDVSRTALVDADLRDRPVRQALEYVLGSVGLRIDPRVGVWHVRPSLHAPSDPVELREVALSAYLSAQRDFPDHPAAAEALLNQGEIEQARGHLAAGRERFDEVVERFPDAEVVPAALLRSGRVLERLLDWEQAAGRYADLLRLERAHPYEVPARVALARCTVELGSSQRALAMLDALDSSHPPADAADASERRVVRAAALVAGEDHEAALALLADLETVPLERTAYLETLQLSARALEGVGRPGDAARRWLLYGQEVEGSERTIALRHAASAALEAGDEVAVLFIRELAAEGGDPAALEPQVDQARERLGLDLEPASAAPADEELEHAEELLAQGRAREALEAVARIEHGLAGAARRDPLRLVLAKARALAAVQGVDTAIDALRDAVPQLDDPEARRQLYLLAGELYETVGRVDEAIEAYQGRL